MGCLRQKHAQIRYLTPTGVNEGKLGYIEKTPDGNINSIIIENLFPNAVEFSEYVFIVTRKTADEYLVNLSSEGERQVVDVLNVGEDQEAEINETTGNRDTTVVRPSQSVTQRVSWVGDIPPQKWTLFYRNVVSSFATSKGLKLTVSVEIAPEGGISRQKIEEMKLALRELGVGDSVEIS